MTTSQQWTWQDGVLSGVLGLSALLLYTRTVAPSILPGDWSEYQFVLYTLGLPHPTGYPLYVLLGHVWSWLPLGTVAYRLNVLSAVVSALTLPVVYLVLRRLIHTPGLSFALALNLGVTPTFWSQALLVGSYPLNTFFFATLWLALLHYWPHGQGLGRVLFLYGLSLTHHRTSILLAPALGVGLWLRPPAARDRWAVARYALALGLPLLIYLYIPVRAWQLGRADLGTPTALWEYMTGKVFAPLLFEQGWVGLPARLQQWGAWSLQELGGVGCGLAAVGAGVLLRQQPRLGVMLGLAYVGYVAFNLNYYIGNIFIYYLPTYLLLMGWLGVALHAGAAAVAQRWPRLRPSWLEAGFACLLIGLAGARVGQDYAQRDMSQAYALENLWQDALALPLAPASVVLTGWQEHTGLVYYQVVAHQRPDLRPWIETPANWQTALTTGEPVYALTMPPTWAGQPIARRGPLLELNPATTAGPRYPQPLVFGDCVQLVGHTFTPLRRDALGQLRYALTLWWAKAQRPTCNFAFSVRMQIPTQPTWFQYDTAPVQGVYPLAAWAATETVLDQLVLAPPPLPTAADLQLIVYDAATGTPWPLTTGETTLVLETLPLPEPTQP